MKHFIHNLTLAGISHMAKFRQPPRSWGKLPRIFGCLMAFCFTTSLVAQDCDLACNASIDAPIQLSVGTDCIVNLDFDGILEAPQECEGMKSLVLRNEMNILVADGMNEVSFDASSYLDKTLSVTVTDVETGVFCVGFVHIIDKLAPKITKCEEVTVNCVADTSPESTGFPEVADNCSNDIEMNYSDDILPGNCTAGTMEMIHRTWVVTDEFGNADSCRQVITVERPTLAEVVFPENIDLSCDNPDAGQEITGAPTFDGQPIDTDNNCGLIVKMTADTAFICDTYEYQIHRTWLVTDVCSGFDSTDLQIIHIKDTTPPEITCPPDFSVTTESGDCITTIELPEPSIIDNCDVGMDYDVIASFGAVGLGPHPFVPAGTHTVQYLATDACGNEAICTMTVEVVDDDEPTAVCEDLTVISVPSGGIAMVLAKTFDDGSFDNCQDEVFFKARRMNLGECEGANGDDSAEIDGYQEWFDDRVLFCCGEAETGEIQVIMRVYELDPGEGPVNPAREVGGGDLDHHYSECMVMVEIQDKLPPRFLTCPPVDTIECDSDYSDLSIFGHPRVDDNCGYTLDSTAVEAIDDCKVGSIVRTWTATDAVGNSSSCRQEIFVINSNPFTEDDIVWPADYVTDVCGSTVDPDDLPDGFNEPQILGEHCGVIALNHEDQIFDVAQPACFKVLRTWTVIDWCRYDPDNPNGEGKFKSIQIIKVQDHVAPVITCPADVTVGVSNDCEKGEVELGLATGDDCSPGVLITNNSPFATNHGANASGTYPLGTTIVTYSASDRCGNVSSCEVSVTVSDDEPPQPLCIVGLSASIYEENGSLMARLDATAFDAGSRDNCTPPNQLKYTIRRNGDEDMNPPNTTSIVFGCEDLGTKLVELWVTDALGNSNYCLTYIDVQDNNELCPQSNEISGAQLAGGITTEDGEYIEGVDINVTGGGFFQMATGDNGSYLFSDIPFGEDYTVVPVRNDHYLNGVTTIDLVLISKHILNIQPLNSPYKMVAADIDRSGHISTMDLIRLRRLILHVDEELPNGNKSWRFIDADYRFPDPKNPFITYFPEIVNINDLDYDEMHADFIGIKVGDVNQTVFPNSLLGIDDRSSYGEILLETAHQKVQKNQTYTLHFSAPKMRDLMAFQFTLQFDTEFLEFVSLKEGSIPAMGADNFGLNHVAQGLITSSWNELEPTKVSEKEILFSLEFRAKADGRLADWVALSSRLTPPEAYDKEGELYNLRLAFTNPDQTENQFELHQNKPNPFEQHTTIAFNMPQYDVAKLSIFDMAGKVVYQHEALFQQGYNEIVVYKDQLSSGGIFYYSLETADKKETKKMILLD